MAAALLWMLPSCKPTEDPMSNLADKVTVATAEPNFVTSRTATCGAEVTAENTGLLIEIGVCWSKSANPTVDDNVMKSYKCSKPYNCMLTNLEPNTKYYVRGFVKYGTEYCYGDEKTFTSLGDDVPATSPVTTLEPTEITYWTFIAGAKVEPFGVTNYTVGICYSTRPEFTIEDCEGYDFGSSYNNETNVYEVYCDGLSPNTQYYYRAYVGYNDGSGYYNNYFYGEILSFTTPEVPFVLNLETYYPDFYGGNDWGRDIIAYGGGYCTNLQLIDQIGFCYSKDNEYPQYESDLFTIAATPTGDMHFEFSSYISNLSANTKYYIRSYARYMTDSIKYGNVVSVDTY
jgi:hypothetical protein